MTRRFPSKLFLLGILAALAISAYGQAGGRSNQRDQERGSGTQGAIGDMGYGEMGYGEMGYGSGGY